MGSRCDSVNLESEIVVSIIVMVINIVEIIVIFRLKKKSNFEITLISLSISDFLYALFNAGLKSIRMFTTREEFVDFKIPYFMHLLCIFTSILHLNFIALNRLLVILKPVAYKIWLTRKKLFLILITFWITSGIITGVLFLTTSSSKKVTRQNITEFQHQHLNLSLSTSIQKPIPSNAQEIPKNAHKNTSVQLTHSPIVSPTKKKRREKKKRKKKNKIKEIFLSYCIIFSDIVFLTLYSIIIYKSRRLQHLRVRNRVTYMSILVSLCFIVTTSPYSITWLTEKRFKVWISITLVVGCGVNSFIYFFHNLLEECYKRRKIGLSRQVTTSSVPAV